MDNLGRIDRQRFSTIPILFGDHPKYGKELRKGFFPSWHESVAPGNGWDFRDPTIW